MMQPLVSVVIPSYNHEEYVRQAIASVLDQTYKPIELVVVDDGSTDGSWESIRALEAASGGAFRSYRKRNGGVSSALNWGVARTAGPLVAVLASDDYFLPSKIADQVHVFNRCSASVGLVHTSAYNDYGDGELIDLTGLYPAAEGLCFPQLIALDAVAVAPSVMFRREVYDFVGGFDEGLVAEDLDFYVRVAAKGFEFRYVPKPLVVKRATGSNLGLNVESNYAAHLSTLEKFVDQIDAELYEYARLNITVSKARHAAGAGDLKLAARCYLSAAHMSQSVKPLAEMTRRCLRYVLLKMLPPPAKRSLRRLRSAKAKRRSRA